MSRRHGVACLVLLVAAGCARRPDPDEKLEVVVAGLDVAAGTALQVEMLARRWVPAQFVSENTVRADQASEAIGKVVVIGLRTGDPVLRSALGHSATEPGFSSRVEPAWRGHWLEVRSPVDLTEVLRRGDRVDVLVALKDPQTGEDVATTVAQGQVVLDVRARAVALRLSAEDSQRLVLAAELGSLSVAVRNLGDRDVTDAGRATLDSLLPPQSPARAAQRR